MSGGYTPLDHAVIDALLGKKSTEAERAERELQREKRLTRLRAQRGLPPTPPKDVAALVPKRLAYGVRRVLGIRSLALMIGTRPDGVKVTGVQVI